MNALLPYAIKVLVCSGILYAYYALALKNNPFHRWNRGFILLAVIASLLIPALQFSVQAAPAAANEMNMIIVVAYVNHTVQQAGASITSWLPITLYGLVALILLVDIARNWVLIKRLVRSGEKTQRNGYRMITHPQVKSTFSFFGDIFWSDETTPDTPQGRQMLKHELEHVRARHTADKLFMQLVCAVCWFNPFFHLFKKELVMVHEFLADRAAAEEEAKEDYARTLLQITLQTRLPLLTNSFSQSPVKRRILMLFTQNTNYTLMKKIIIFPIVLLLGFAIGCQQELDLNIKKDKPVSTSGNPSAKKALEGDVLTFVSDPPSYPGGEDALMRYLSSNIHYPKEAQDLNIAGTIFVNFVVDKDGYIQNVKTVGNRIGAGLEEESLRVVNEMPKWNPGRQDGEAVNVAFNLPIRFVLQD
ncbi:M56 family metallopeptidase [Chitinophaga rhizophila]|uniref:M56 family metallopeptidase n=1 Tax=Chitinophaga rhizophila TaxID=2866212 RepID=A0ABS7GBN5_9BACT|nr:M56 family metallopeptidase [Chitinophaga rhizophila]MBW8685087.1 M56 family metallopeptidase [Chitinophaga rhizophila]